MSVYFIYEPYMGEVTDYENKKAFMEAVDSFDFMQDYCDDGWSLEVENVLAGIAPYKWDMDKHEDEIDESDFYQKHATHHPVKINERTRPDDVDEEGMDSDGTYWGEWEYICGYAFEEIVSNA